MAGEVVGAEVGLGLEDDVPSGPAIRATGHERGSEQVPRHAIGGAGEEVGVEGL
jgi:hypothetical protein